MIAGWLLGGIAVLGVIANRRRIARQADSEYRQRHTFSSDGIALGAEGFVLSGTSGSGVLLVHGSGDSPQSLRFIAGRLNQAGYSVMAPLLAGHGRSPRAFARATADDYYDGVRVAFEQLASENQSVSLVGLSMGGAIVARLAAESVGVSSVVLLAPYLIVPPVIRRVAALSWLWGMLTPYLAGRGEASVHDAQASLTSRAYGTFSPGALRALTRTADAGFRALPKLTMSVLVINSDEDNRIPRELAEHAIAHIPAPIEERWVSGCGHVITIDYCKDEVARLVVSFLNRHRTPPRGNAMS